MHQLHFFLQNSKIFYKIIVQISFRFAQILYSLESKYQPLTVVPPGTVDKLMTMGSSPCFCSPSHTEKPLSPTRDRAETIVEPPPPTFTDITQV